MEAEKNSMKISYHGIEAYPVNFNELRQLNYVAELRAEQFGETFRLMRHTMGEKENYRKTLRSLNVSSRSMRLRMKIDLTLFILMLLVPSSARLMDCGAICFDV